MSDVLGKAFRRAIVLGGSVIGIVIAGLVGRGAGVAGALLLFVDRVAFADAERVE